MSAAARHRERLSERPASHRRARGGRAGRLRCGNYGARSGRKEPISDKVAQPNIASNAAANGEHASFLEPAEMLGVVWLRARSSRRGWHKLVSHVSLYVTHVVNCNLLLFLKKSPALRRGVSAARRSVRWQLAVRRLGGETAGTERSCPQRQNSVTVFPTPHGVFDVIGTE